MKMENEVFKEELDKMEIRLSDMEDKLDRLDEKLTQVVDAILGNPLTKQGGFMHDIELLKSKIEDLEKKQLRYESFKNKVSWTVGLVMGAAMLLQYIISIYTNIKK
jgi:prefoldin subunit 5